MVAEVPKLVVAVERTKERSIRREAALRGAVPVLLVQVHLEVMKHF
jgi:hypothetical protein